jgi:integrase
MAIIQNLDQHYIDTQLVCPPGKSRVEIVDPQRTGLYIEVRIGNPGQGTYYLRHKSGSKTSHEKIGRTGDLPLAEARAAAAKFKAGLRTAPALPASQPSPVAPAQPDPPKAQAEMTLDMFWKDHYLPHAKAHKRSAWRDEQLYRRIQSKFGALPLRSVTRLAVQQFQNALLGEHKLAKSTVNQHVVLMRRMLNLAVSWEMLEKNVLTRIPLFHLDNQVEHFLDDQQVDKLVEVLKTDENRAVCLILFFLLSTGARRSEGLKAEWKDVNVEKQTWRIPATNSKSKKMKTLPLNPGAMWVVEQLASRGTSPYLFPSPATGKPFTEITRVWYRLRKKAGLASNTRIHDLRHTFASRLVSSGRSLFEVQQLLGHADPRMSMRYAHLSMKAMQEASNAASLNVA